MDGRLLALAAAFALPVAFVGAVIVTLGNRERAAPKAEPLSDGIA